MQITNFSNVEYTYTLPDGSSQTANKDSNIVTTEILTYSFTKVKSSNKTFLQEGEIAIQTIVLTNNSPFNLSNLFFTDTLSSGANHVVGSVIVNGVAQPTYDIIAGFKLDDMAPNDVTTINYNVQANNPLTENLFNNFGTLAYTAAETNFNENTNTIEIAVVSNRLDIVKTVDKQVALKGDTLHYTSTITNTGTLEKTNLTFTDQIPVGTSFIAGSVKIDGVTQGSYNPGVGFPLPNLAVGANTVVEFDVVVL